jgi:mRNA interferase MazF
VRGGFSRRIEPRRVHGDYRADDDDPARVEITFQGKTGEIALDQIRAVDKSRLVKRLGKLDSETADAVLDTLGELFAP